MAARIVTAAFEGVDARRIDVEVQISSGMVAFIIVGLGDKAVAESRERVRAAFSGLGLALPAKRIVVNLAPADMPKEGSHYDLPIALGLMAVMDIIPEDVLSDWLAFGELSLDGRIVSTAGVLPAAMAAKSMGLGLICPEAGGSEAAWAGDGPVLPARSLIALIQHFRGSALIPAPKPGLILESADSNSSLDLRDVKGQEAAKRALEIAAAGGHNLLFRGPPGAGKSMLASRLPGILPPLSPKELLETSLVHSMAGLIAKGSLTRARPFRSPHHSASMAALVGGGARAKPGEVSLAHNGVLFLDELPEFTPQVLDSLRQPLEAGEVVVARANAHLRYPARIQLVAAMNPCRCGYGGSGRGACGRAPRCQLDYQSRISGPLLDRIDITLDMPAVTPADLALPSPQEGTAEVAGRVAKARAMQEARNILIENEAAPNRQTEATDCDEKSNERAKEGLLNARIDGLLLEQVASPDPAGKDLLLQAADKGRLTARGWGRTLRLARTIADLEGASVIRRVHIAEALAYRAITLSADREI